MFSRIIEFDKHQGTTYKGPKGNLTITVEDIRSLPRDLEVLWNTSFWKKGDLSSEETKLALFLFALSSVTTLKGQFTLVQTIIWQILLKLQDLLFTT